MLLDSHPPRLRTRPPAMHDAWRRGLRPARAARTPCHRPGRQKAPPRGGGRGAHAAAGRLESCRPPHAGGGRGLHYFLVSADISPSAGSSKTTGFILRRRLGHEMLSGISCLHCALEFFQYFCCSEVFRYVYVYTIGMDAVRTVLHLQLLRIFLSLSVKLCSDYFDMQSCRHSVLSCGFSCFLFHTQFVFPAAGKASAGRNPGQ